MGLKNIIEILIFRRTYRYKVIHEANSYWAPTGKLDILLEHEDICEQNKRDSPLSWSLQSFLEMYYIPEISGQELRGQLMENWVVGL